VILANSEKNNINNENKKHLNKISKDKLLIVRVVICFIGSLVILVIVFLHSLLT
jgi:hypothetical protein